MTRLLLALGLLAISTVKAQDLATRIPHDAFAVVNIQTGQFFKLMTVQDFDRSTIGKALVDMAEKMGVSDVASVADYGFELESTSYFYTSNTDSLTHFTVLIPLADAQTFQRIFAADEAIQQRGSSRLFTKSLNDEQVTFVWDDHTLCISSGSPVSSYFENEEVANRYGLTYDHYNDDDYYAADSAVSVIVDSAGDWNDTADITIAPPVAKTEEEPAIEEMTETTEEAAEAAVEVAVEPTEEAAVVADSTTDWWTDTLGNIAVEDAAPYEDYYTKNVRIKDSLAGVWAREYAEAVLAKVPEKNIRTNASYLRSVKKDALITGWISNLEAIYSTLLPDLFGMRGNGKLFNYYGSVYAGLYADGEGFRLGTEMEVSDELARSFKRIYSAKLNRKFLKYVNSQEAVGFFGFAMDSKAYLEELPKMLNDTYGKVFAQYEKDISLGAEIVSLLLDEEAIASAARGDGLFVLNGIAEKEVTYTDYEYDENYNYKEVEKTKMETIPDFLLLFSSDNASLYNRIVDYLQHKMLLSEDRDIYHIGQSELPFDLYLYRRGNIVFLGTSETEMENIRDNRIQGAISNAHRKLLTKNRFAGLMSTKKFTEGISEEQLHSLDNYIAFRKLFGNLGDFYFRSNGIKGNTVAGEFVAQTPEGYDNAVQYLFALIDYAAQQK